jgi:hypothetical protein
VGSTGFLVFDLVFDQSEFLLLIFESAFHWPTTEADSRARISGAPTHIACLSDFLQRRDLGLSNSTRQDIISGAIRILAGGCNDQGNYA